MMTVDDRCDFIHAYTEHYETNIMRQYHALNAMDQSGWDERTTAMIWLRKDAQTLRMLAASLDNLRMKMTRQEVA